MTVCLDELHTARMNDGFGAAPQLDGVHKAVQDDVVKMFKVLVCACALVTLCVWVRAAHTHARVYLRVHLCVGHVCRNIRTTVLACLIGMLACTP